MLVEGEGDSGWKEGARLCQEAFAPSGQRVSPVPVCHLSLWPQGVQWLELSQCLSPPLPPYISYSAQERKPSLKMAI